MNNSNAMNVEPITHTARAAAMQHERLLRAPDVADRNARQAQAYAETFLADLRKSPADPARVEPLIVLVAEIVDAGAAALSRYDGHVAEVLCPAEANYREAFAAKEAADAAYLLGTVGGDEAVENSNNRERAHAAFRVRDRELTEAQKPARLPTVGLPKEAREAERATSIMASAAAKYGVDMRTSLFDRRSAIDPAAMAMQDARTAEPSTAIFWVAFEERFLAEHGDAARRHRRNGECPRSPPRQRGRRKPARAFRVPLGGIPARASDERARALSPERGPMTPERERYLERHGIAVGVGIPLFPENQETTIMASNQQSGTDPKQKLQNDREGPRGHRRDGHRQHPSRARSTF